MNFFRQRTPGGVPRVGGVNISGGRPGTDGFALDGFLINPVIVIIGVFRDYSIGIRLTGFSPVGVGGFVVDALSGGGIGGKIVLLEPGADLVGEVGAGPADEARLQGRGALPFWRDGTCQLAGKQGGNGGTLSRGKSGIMG